MAFRLLAILYIILAFAVPIFIIIFIVHLFARSRQKGKAARPMTDREFILGMLAAAAGLAGLISLYELPAMLVSDDRNSEPAIFAIRIVIGISLLLVGLLLQEFTGKFLMVIGVIFMVLASPFLFENLGSFGAFLAVLFAFIALIAAAVHFNKKSRHPA